MTNSTQAAAPEDVGFCAERLDRIPQYFKSYIDRKKLPGTSLLISRRGKVALRSIQGVMDWDSGEPIKEDTIFRIYSMSKPITSVGLMMLYEEGAFRLEHEVSRYIPGFGDVKVFDGGTADDYKTRALDHPINIRDLMTHTSGLTYGFIADGPVEKLYRRAGLGGARDSEMTLAEFIDELVKQPLVFSPGTSWRYSVATDVCGRLIEILSGQSLDVFFEERIFKPLGMSDTGFTVPKEKIDRFASCYERDPMTKKISLQDSPATSPYLSGQAFLSGGGGLVSTMDDYARFCQMLLNGGELDGTRLLSPITLDFMTENHLPDNQTMQDMGDDSFSETRADGSGFGLGFSVVLDTVAAAAPGSIGAFSWGGMASTFFWIDPQEDLFAIIMTQMIPSTSYPIRPQLQQLTYAAIVD